MKKIIILTVLLLLISSSANAQFKVETINDSLTVVLPEGYNVLFLVMSPEGIYYLLTTTEKINSFRQEPSPRFFELFSGMEKLKRVDADFQIELTWPYRIVFGLPNGRAKFQVAEIFKKNDIIFSFTYRGEDFKLRLFKKEHNIKHIEQQLR